MVGGSYDRRVVSAILFIVSVTPLVYIIGRRILRKQRRPPDCGSGEKEETMQTKTMEDETETSTAAREQGNFNHKVFISFRGKDTRNGFTSHLHKELKTHGITAFIDSEDLEKGEKISVLFDRIEWSKIFLPVFSTNYADSKWCLREISKIVEINKKEGKKRPIIPIFYHVDPSNVRHCRGSFGKAFKNHQQDKKLGEEEINEWKAALKAAGELSGYCLSTTEGNEAEIISCISKRVSDILCKVPFDIQPVGIVPCIHTLKQMLEREKDDLCMMGICGLGGLGKTTLAMALYNQLSPTFEGSCFLSNIRSKSENRDGLTNLQSELMKEVLGRETKKIATVEEGVSLIKQLLGVRKVLLILDDVDDKEQLEAFSANRRTKGKWFGEGSKIIVTTRDERVLLQHGLRECDIYFPEGLNREDSLQLFCHHAFLSDQPLEGFEKLSREVVEVAGGLPLALKVFGPLFYDLKEKKEWEEMLETLKRDQHKKVHERLKISYDSLDQNQQCVFLDIACFFIGKTKEHPVYMWEACGYFPRLTLKVLQHKSLIEINEGDMFEMHDQIRDMGRMIVKEEGNSDPLKYSRPWSKDKKLEVLEDAKVSLGNSYIQGIDLNEVYNEVSWRVIEAMPKLRMLTGANGMHHGFEDEEESIRLPSNIRWLEWTNCPYQTLTFHNNKHEQLCVLDLSYGHFRDLRSHRMVFPNLKILVLSRCQGLIQTPDFTYLPSLEVLLLSFCGSLIEMGESIGQLEKLVKLSLWGCNKLKRLPAGLCKLSSLEFLDICECQGILVLPTQIGDLTSLKYLSLKSTSISDVPDSIGSLQSLQQLYLSRCKEISILPKQIGDLISLKDLALCGTSISVLPDYIGSLQSLEKLDLSECTSLQKIPDSIGDLKSLSQLSLRKCKLLEQLPNSMGMLSSLKELNIDHCKSLREVPHSLVDLNNDIQISLEGCILLEKLPNFIKIGNASLRFDGCKSLRRLPDSLGNGMIVRLLSLHECESLEELPDSMGIRMETLKELDLSGCILLRMIPESIGYLKSLKRLSLKHCQSLEGLPECTGMLLSLEELDLSGCTWLRTIPESIGNLKNLNRLILSGCQSLEELPECIGKLLTLEVLDLSGCTLLTTIPETIRYLSGLTHLSLKDCPSLEELSEVIGTLLFLEKLDLSGCTLIKRIPESIGDLKRLKHLNLEDSRSLKALPESMGGLDSLKVLHICGGMSVKKMPDFLGKLKNLEKLYLREIEEIPDSIGMLTSLRELHLTGCSPSNCQSLEKLPKALDGLTSLEMLSICGGMSVNLQHDFMNNNITLLLSELEEIPEFIGRFPPMVLIVIENCPKLESLPQLPSPLTSLWILGCVAFKKFSDPSTLNCLVALCLAGCKDFTDLSGLTSLKSLKALVLTDRDGLSRDLMDKLSQASFEELAALFICGASDGSDLLFGLPKSNVGQVQRLGGSFYLTDELPFNASNINIHIQVLVEGKLVTEVTCIARRIEEEDDDARQHELWGLGGQVFYDFDIKEGEEIVKWVEEGNTTLRVLTTYNHYRLRMALLQVSYLD